MTSFMEYLHHLALRALIGNVSLDLFLVPTFVFVASIRDTKAVNVLDVRTVEITAIDDAIMRCCYILNISD